MLSREHDNDVKVLFQRTHQDLSTILNILEGRFLYLIKEEANGALPSEGVAGELSLLSRDIKSCFQRLLEMQERRDLSFKATRELEEIDQRCVWLFRKIRVQQTFLRKLRLEAKLRDLVSAEAFNIYETLLNLDEEERETLASDDIKIRELVLTDKQANTPPHPAG